MPKAIISKSTGRLLYYCPPCKQPHTIEIDGSRAWTWNGNLITPTVSPSIKVTCPPMPYCCHHFVRNGRIEYCGDCSHELSGKTIDMVDVPEHWRGD